MLVLTESTLNWLVMLIVKMLTTGFSVAVMEVVAARQKVDKKLDMVGWCGSEMILRIRISGESTHRNVTG